MRAIDWYMFQPWHICVNEPVVVFFVVIDVLVDFLRWRVLEKVNYTDDMLINRAKWDLLNRIYFNLHIRVKVDLQNKNQCFSHMWSMKGLIYSCNNNSVLANH